MTYDSLRFPDAQRLRSFEVNEDSAYGTLLTCKTKKQHGQFWPRACPKLGIAGTREWAKPLPDMRQAYRRVNGVEPTFTFPRIDHAWELVAAEPAPYSTTRRRLALMCVALGDPEGERYTLHSPRNLFPTDANQLRFDHRELNIIGHWATNSRMPDRYDRSACAADLLLRNTIVHRMHDGWGVAPEFRLPETAKPETDVGGTRLVGSPQAVNELEVDIAAMSTPEDSSSQGAGLDGSKDERVELVEEQHTLTQEDNMQPNES